MYLTHIKEEVSTLRVFTSGDSYENRDTPMFSCTVHFISDDEVYICNAVGSFNRTVWKTISQHLTAIGYSILRYERRGKNKYHDTSRADY